MKIVEVLNVPVRYGNTTYQPGSSFEMEENHVNENLVIVVGEVEKAPKQIEDYTVAELKAYADEKEIDLGEAKKRDELLEVILTFEAEAEGNE